MAVVTNRAEIAWIDVAKAACIILVVMMHCESQIYVAGWAQHDRLIALWKAVNTFVRPIRMPLFFLISGLLSSRSISSDCLTVTSKRLLRPLYLYLIWAAIFMLVIPNYPYAGATGLGAWEKLERLVFLGSPAWYLLALALFYLLAKVTREWPAPTVLGLCALLSVCGTIFLPDYSLYSTKLLRCAVFFVGGVRLREQIERFVARATPRRAVALLALYASGEGLALGMDTYLLPVDLLAVALGVTIMALSCVSLGALAPVIRFLGNQTLLVYLLHFPLIVMLSGMVRELADPGILGNFWLGLSYPILMTITVIPLSLLLGSFMKTVGLGWLFDLPRAWNAVVLPRIRENRAPAAALPQD